MESLLENIKLITFFGGLLFFIRMFFLTFKNVSRRVKEKKIVKEKYPGMTKKDYNTRAVKIKHYENVNILTGLRRSLFRLWGFLMAVSYVSIVSFGIINDNFIGLVISMGFTMIFIGLHKAAEPKYVEKIKLWEKYLKENQENPFKIVLIYDDSVTVWEKKWVFTSVVSGICLIISQVVSLFI